MAGTFGRDSSSSDSRRSRSHSGGGCTRNERRVAGRRRTSKATSLKNPCRRHRRHRRHRHRPRQQTPTKFLKAGRGKAQGSESGSSKQSSPPPPPRLPSAKPSSEFQACGGRSRRRRRRRGGPGFINFPISQRPSFSFASSVSATTKPLIWGFRYRAQPSSASKETLLSPSSTSSFFPFCFGYFHRICEKMGESAHHHQRAATTSSRLAMRGGGGEIVEVQGGRIVRSTGRKDRHSKVCTAKGPRDRRVRLSAHTAIQFYDVQDRLGYDRPSKAVDWLINNAKAAIDELTELPVWNPHAMNESKPTTTAVNENPPATCPRPGSPTSSGSVRLGDLYAEEERELLVELRVPAWLSGPTT